MAKRQKLHARKRRIELMMLLGGYCAKCSCEDELEFDCIEPRGDRHHKMDTSARMCFYFKEYREGNLQLLCPKCHAKKTKQDLENNPY